MKFNFDIKNKKAGFEADVEKIVEKGMDQHEKDWKDKFETKHNAKKEIMEMKHKHKMEIENNNQNKMNFIQKMQEEKRKQMEIEIQEEHRKEIEHEKRTKKKIRISIMLGIIGMVLLIVGTVLGEESGNPDSGLYAIAALGIFPLCAIAMIWGIDSEENKKRKK